MESRRRVQKSALGIDWWSKYIGVAHTPINSDVIFPVWYLLNDQMIYFHLGDLIRKYHVSKIVVWCPTKQKDIQEKIQKFLKSLSFIIDQDAVEVVLVDEDYSSVQSWEIVSDTFKTAQWFKKNPAEDTISAMIILERWKKNGTIENPL